MTLVVASVIADTPDELARLAAQAAREADVVEVRLDGPSGLPWDLRPYFGLLAKPTIATMRAEADGGRSHADDVTRAEVLRRALRAGARWIDVELASDEAATLVADAHAMGAKAIMSVHDLEATPSAEEILSWLRKAHDLGADVAKVATRAESPADAAALVEAALAARREGIACAVMAVNDPMLRLLAPALGLAFAYGTPGGSATPTAAGQLPASRLRDVHEDLARALGGQTRGSTRLALLLGHPVAHSKSPAMQNAAFAATGVDARYVALDAQPGTLAPLLAALKVSNALGANVTVPHKLEALAACDELDASARRAGAVNTVVFRDGRSVGHNTDGEGALDALAEAGFAAAGMRALVLGAGGAARAVAAALQDAGARVLLANRTAENAEATARALGLDVVPWSEVAPRLGEIDLLVNATTVGLLDATSPIDPKRLREGAAVLDCVYRRGGTTLVRLAHAAGLRAVGGESMLLHQGARAFRLWTGLEPPVAAMRAALEEAQ